VGLAANVRSLQQTFKAKIAQRVNETLCCQAVTCTLYHSRKQ